MPDSKPRYEFRVWGSSLADVRARLEALAAPSRTENSRETYLIVPAAEHCNAKIRGGLMDIKQMVAVERGLEQWKPVFKREFPLDRAAIGEVFAALGLPAPQLSRERYSIDEFLHDAGAVHGPIRIVPVSKARVHFEIDRCQAEFAAVTLGQVARDTVAVESADADAVIELTQRLGIGGRPNTSYVRQIKQLLQL